MILLKIKLYKISIEEGENLNQCLRKFYLEIAEKLFPNASVTYGRRTNYYIKKVQRLFLRLNFRIEAELTELTEKDEKLHDPYKKITQKEKKKFKKYIKNKWLNPKLK